MGALSLADARRFLSFLPRLALMIGLMNACGRNVPEPAKAPASDGPARIVLAVDGNPNGLYWDTKHDELLIADDGNNRILSYSDAHGFSVAELLPDAGGAGAGLGQLVMTPDGTLVVTRFGRGKGGGVLFVTPGAEPQLVPGLDPERRRIGLTVGTDGQLFDSWFVKGPDARRGGLGVLSLSGTEAEVPSHLTKPVGVLLREDTLFVSDQDQGEVLQAPRSEPSALSAFARLERPDLLTSGPDGSLFTGGAGGKLYRISSDGTATVFASGFGEVRGVAYDPARHRVFVIDHGTPDSAKAKAGENDGAPQTVPTETAAPGAGDRRPHTPHTLCILAVD